MGVWILCLAAMLAGQWLIFHPPGYRLGMRAEKLWAIISLAAFIVVSVMFLVGVQWVVREKSHRLIVRIVGFVASLVAVLASLAISLERLMLHGHFLD